MKNRIVNTLTLQTAGGRITAWALLTVLIYFCKYQWLGNLSLWQRMGWDWAPSIGLTRAYWLLMHEGIQPAWERNPLIFAVLAIGIPLLIWDAYKLYKDRITEE